MRGIPPKTSTGTKRKKQSSMQAIIGNGITLSIGRGGIGAGAQKIQRITESSSNTGSWEFSTHVYENRKRKNIQYPSIGCISDIIGDYNGNGNLGVILQFNGFSFLEVLFSKSKKDYGENSCVYYIHILYKNKGAFLILSTSGDLLEYEVVPRKKGISRLFRGEIPLPELTAVYEPASMEVMLNNGIVLVAYKSKSIFPPS